MPTSIHFERALSEIIANAERRRLNLIEISSGELHRAVGGYPGPDHRMPVCCNTMRPFMRPGDKILHQPPKGDGATLRIRYSLPRHQPRDRA